VDLTYNVDPNEFDDGPSDDDEALAPIDMWHALEKTATQNFCDSNWISMVLYPRPEGNHVLMSLSFWLATKKTERAKWCC
jgi:hypothetical protein